MSFFSIERFKGGHESEQVNESGGFDPLNVCYWFLLPARGWEDAKDFNQNEFEVVKTA